MQNGMSLVESRLYHDLGGKCSFNSRPLKQTGRTTWKLEFPNKALYQMLDGALIHPLFSSAEISESQVPKLTSDVN